jgi:hypothetical protein
MREPAALSCRLFLLVIASISKWRSIAMPFLYRKGRNDYAMFAKEIHIAPGDSFFFDCKGYAGNAKLKDIALIVHRMPSHQILAPIAALSIAVHPGACA